MSPEENRSSRIPRLYHWFLDQCTRDDGTEYTRAHGNVTGHKSLPDTLFIHTSRIEHIEVKEDAGEVMIQTKNTEYHCKLADCDFSKPGTYDHIPGLAEYAEIYGKEKEYQQEDNSILLVLSDHEGYYFKAISVKENGNVRKGSMYPHIGTYQDSCLLSCDGCEKRIDIRYFPHSQHLETYCWETGGLPVYLENAGDEKIYYTANEGTIELKPGERKLVSEENVMQHDERPVLSRGDLYPAVVLDGGESDPQP